MLVLVLSIPVLFAGELAPVLAPLAEAHKKEVEQLAEEREAAIRGPRDSYLVALKRADEEATAKGDQELLAAITKETRLVDNGGITPLPPALFPRKLQGVHRTFVKAVEKVDAGIDRKRKDANSRYLIALAQIKPKPGDDALVAQIEAEKERVLSGISGPITDLRTQLKGTRWQSVAEPDNVHLFKPDGYFIHWRYTTPERDELIIHWNENSRKHLKLAKDGRTLLSGGVPDMVLVPEQSDHQE